MDSLYIATTGLSEFWSRADPVLLLGPWCRRGLKKFTPGQYEELPCIWDKEHSMPEAESVCWDIFCRWTPRLGETLNSIHRTDHSKKYWEILLSVWFLHFINVIYDRFLLLQSAARAAKNPWTTVLPRHRYVVAPTSFSAIKGSAYDDAYNLQLFSEVARLLGLAAGEDIPAVSIGNGAGPRNGATRWETAWRTLGNARAGFLRATVSAANRLSLPFAGPENGLMLYLGGHYDWSDLLSLSVPAGVRMILPSDSETDGSGNGSLSLEARQRSFADLPDTSVKDAFEKLVLSSTPWFIPTCFVEEYASLVAHSQKRFGTEPKSLIFDSPALYNDPGFLEYAARCAETGKRITSIQHGGAYGHTLSSPAERIEIDLCDGFVSFGWKDDRSPEKTRPLPNPHLSQLKRASKPHDSILYISFFGKTYLHRLVSVPHAAQWDDYLVYCETFLESLSRENLSRVRFRPYFGYGGHPLPPLMESLLKSERREKRFASQALADCRLAIIDHASTSWIEAFACNTPTILFWNPSHWRFRPAAEPVIAMLAAIGILHFDPAAAARKVEEVYDRAEEWWAGEEIQAARAQFCERYAWAVPDWRSYWVKALRELKAS
jgi:hypothetical protein